MKRELILLFSLVLTGCATGHDRWISEQQEVYKKSCLNWQKTKAKKLQERKTGEEMLSVQDLMVKRCQEDPSICTPPHKHNELTSLEEMWGAPKTPDSCVDLDKY